MKPRIAQLLAILPLLFASSLAVILSIDLGESYTKSFLLAPGVSFEPVLSSDSKRKDLTGVTFKDTPGEGGIQRIFGNSAQNFLVRYPAQSLFFYKPLLGANYATSPRVQEYQARFPGVSLVPAKNNRSTVAVELLDEAYPVEELLATYLIDIKTRADATLKTTKSGSAFSISNTVVTVPPHYNIFQRQAIEDAVDLAELNLVSLVNDGVAVITNYVSKNPVSTVPEYHLVYDVGAGSTSASLFSIREVESPASVVIELEGVGYDETFGGNTLTAKLQNLLVERLLAKNKSVKRQTLLADAKAMRKLWLDAERAKNILSVNNEVTSHIESVHEDLDLHTKVTRAELEELLKDDLDKITAPIFDALKNTFPSSTFKNLKQLNSIIYMGGATRTPIVQQTVAKEFGANKISKKVNTDEAASLGGTLRGVGISKMFKTRNITVIDRSLNEYSAIVGDDTVPLFARGDVLDTTNTLIIPKVGGKVPTISLFENDVEFSNVELKNAEDALVTRGCTLEGAQIKATFRLTNSQTVQLTEAWAECVPVKAESESSSSESAESVNSADSESAESVESEESSSAVPERPRTPKPIKVILSKKLRYRNVRPMGTASKIASTSRIHAFERIDKERKKRDGLRNLIENEVYKIKRVLTEYEENAEENDAPHIEQEIRDEVAAGVEELSEWLDYDSHGATIKDLVAKEDIVKALLEKLVPKSSPSPEEEEEAAIEVNSEEAPELEKREDEAPPEEDEVYKAKLTEAVKALQASVEKGKARREGFNLRVESLRKRVHKAVRKYNRKADELVTETTINDAIDHILDLAAEQAQLQELYQETLRLMTAASANKPTSQEDKDKIVADLTKYTSDYESLDLRIDEGREGKIDQIKALLAKYDKKFKPKRKEEL